VARARERKGRASQAPAAAPLLLAIEALRCSRRWMG
jgi:hypothetical protein